MTLSSSDLQSDSDLDSIRNSCDVFLSDHLSRNDLSVDESRGESFFQGMTQWLFYLSLVSITIQNKGVEASTEITFESLWLSAIISILSLNWGQFKL